eukprot:TRINITY_DN8800_c0_g5_i1.p1 TRINITY_DN8800_c0_g5~~TRINITY_DN8800_c0_g5_i1.p1  ORF type:complete len:183 (-),score=41.99 TRINITY_DN8800_c0_g5_i1:91-639(-)
MRSSLIAITSFTFAQLALSTSPVAKQCTADSEKYWALDKPNNECAEACLRTEVQRVEFKVITGGQGAKINSTSTPCADNGFHKFDRTDVLGFGPLKISLDKYLPDKSDLQNSPNPKSKCALACTAKSIAVYWACAAACIKKEAPNSCITAGCVAAVTAADVACLKECPKTDSEHREDDTLVV